MSAICEGGSGTTRADIPEIASEYGEYVAADRPETSAAFPTPEINPNSTNNTEPSTSHTIVTLSLIVPFIWDTRLQKMSWTWNPGHSEVTQSTEQRNRHGSIRHLWLPINVTQPWASEINGEFGWSKIAKFSHSRVFNAPAEGTPLGFGYRRKG